MINKSTNLQRLDFENKNVKKYFKGLQEQKKTTTLTFNNLSDKLELVYGPIIFALCFAVWVYLITFAGITVNG